MSIHCRIRFLTAVLLLSSFSFVLYAAEDLTLEELSKTEAAKFFVQKQYPESLEAFQKLEAEHPRNVLIKRYIASLYDSLQQRGQAIQTLRETVALDPEDWISRQMLGDLYIKEGKLDESEREFQKILQGTGAESSSGKYAQQKLESIKKIRLAPKTEVGKQMAAQEFMQSRPAQEFAGGKYAQALSGFEALLQTYPQDPIILRFRAITILRLKRTEEALAAFQEGLRIAPDNAALHYYFGEAYAQAGNMELARKEYQWVIMHDKGAYQLRAKRALFKTLAGIKQKAPKPWTLTVNNGYEYDTNASFKSRDTNFSQAGDQNSSRFNTSALGTYRFYQKKKWFFTADSLYSQALYSDFPNLQTYTYGGGLSALRVFNLFGKMSYLNIRDGFTHTFLKNKFFVFSHSLSPNLIVNVTDRFRTSLGYRFNFNQYESRGSSPELTNRSGMVNGFSVSGTRYFDDAKKNYVTLGYDFDYDRAQGLNYKKKANTGRMEFHWALPAKFEFNLSFRYKDSFYPKYGSAPPKRWDHQYTLTPSISRPMFRDMVTLTGSYTYEPTPAQNNTFEYFKHVFGVQVSVRL